MTTRTKADRARAFAAQGLSVNHIADVLQISRQAVYAAIKRGGKRKRGRPRTRVVRCKHCGRETT